MFLKSIFRATLTSLTKDFKNAVRGKANSEDKKLLKEAKNRILEQTKGYLKKVLSESISSRDLAKLKTALHEVSVAVQEDIRQVDITSDTELNSILETAKDLMETLSALEKMKAAIMSLKQPTISEIRSYSQPPAAIEVVMQATFILLGEDKKKLKVKNVDEIVKAK